MLNIQAVKNVDSDKLITRNGPDRIAVISYRQFPSHHSKTQDPAFFLFNAENLSIPNLRLIFQIENGYGNENGSAVSGLTT